MEKAYSMFKLKSQELILPHDEFKPLLFPLLKTGTLSQEEDCLLYTSDAADE